MRAFQINAPRGPWVDLDAVQIIYPFENLNNWIEITFRLTFQDEDTKVRVYYPPRLRDAFREAHVAASTSGRNDSWVTLDAQQVEFGQPIWQAFVDAWSQKPSPTQGATP